MNLREGEDYYLLPDGRLVMTAAYLLKRGWCCGNGCLNCPYNYEEVPEPKRSFLLASRNRKPNTDGESAQ
jgi:hypothetical protein